MFLAVKAYKTALSKLGTAADSAQAEAFSRLYFLVGDFFREISQNEASTECFSEALKLQTVRFDCHLMTFTLYCLAWLF